MFAQLRKVTNRYRGQAYHTFGRESLSKDSCNCAIAYGNLALPFSLFAGHPEHGASDACGNVARLVYIKVSWSDKCADFRLAWASRRGKLICASRRDEDHLDLSKLGLSALRKTVYSQRSLLSMDHDSGFVFIGAFPAQAMQADAGAPPTPGLQPGNASLLPDGTGHPEDSSSPLEMRTRNIIARTPLNGPSPASTSPVSTSYSAGTPLSNSTPVSNLQHTPSDSGLSTPSAFGLPDFMLEGDYMGMQTPQIVGMKNPVTAFRENKQLKRHETPFDTRVEHLMEKERLFREMYVQHKSVQGSDAVVRQRRSTGSSKAMADMRSSPQMGIENFPSPTVTTGYCPDQ
ncbi:hypothetical protein WJX77_001575 [Trebouxia sp. C0004]